MQCTYIFDAMQYVFSIIITKCKVAIHIQVLQCTASTSFLSCHSIFQCVVHFSPFIHAFLYPGDMLW